MTQQSATVTQCPKFGWCVMGHAHKGQCSSAHYTLTEVVEPRVEAGDRALETARKIRRFPIMGGPSIPWEAIAPYDSQAKHNHGQTLEELAKRGGLSPAEAWHVLNNSDFGVRTNWDKAEIDGKALLAQINQRYETLQQEVDRLQSAMNAHDKTRLGTDWQELAEKNQETADKALALVDAMDAQERELREALRDALYVMNSRPQQGWDKWRNAVAEAERLLAERGEGR